MSEEVFLSSSITEPQQNLPPINKDLANSAFDAFMKDSVAKEWSSTAQTILKEGIEYMVGEVTRDNEAIKQINTMHERDIRFSTKKTNPARQNSEVIKAALVEQTCRPKSVVSKVLSFGFVNAIDTLKAGRVPLSKQPNNNVRTGSQTITGGAWEQKAMRGIGRSGIRF